MGTSQMVRENPIEASASAVGALLPSDDQTLFGNAFLGSLFGGGEKPQIAKKGLSDSLEETTDRMTARMELEGKFDTENPLGSEGRAAISDEELDEMAALYSDIRRGKSNLKLDTAGMSEEDAAAFRKGAMEDVGTMMQTESGRRMLKELAYNEKGIQTSIGGIKGDGGPVTEAYLEGKRDCSESFKKDRPGDPIGWCIDDRVHDGKGSDSEVHYRPGVTENTDEGPSRSDVTLYHELAHALHNQRGDQADGEVPSARDTTRSVGNDEFQATGLGKWANETDEYGDFVPNENLYRSERRDLGEDLDDRPTYGGTSPAP